MRIAVATRTLERIGGVETYLHHVLPALAARGHELSVWFESSSGRSDSIARGLPVHQLNGPGEPGVSNHLRLWHPEVIFLHGLSAPTLEDQLFDAGPVVTFLHDYSRTCVSGTKTRSLPAPAPCARRFGAACLVQYLPRRCGGWSPLTMAASYRAQRRRQDVLRRSAFVTSLSRHMRAEAVAHGVSEARAVELPPFEPPVIGPRGARRVRDRNARCHLAFVGRMERPKGGHLFLDALARLEPATRARLEVTFAGDGRERARLERAAAKVDGMRIAFTGWLDEAGREELFETVDLLVVPSVWPEPLGLIGLEAAAAGVPALAFDVGGIHEWLEDGVSGRLVPGAHPSARTLAAAIAECAVNLELLRMWSAGAVALSRRRTLSAHVEALEAVLRRGAGRC